MDLKEFEAKLRVIKIHGLDNLNAQIAIEEAADVISELAKEIEELRENLKEERSAYSMAHGIFKSERILFRTVIERCMKAARDWDTPDYPMSTRHAAADIEQQIRKFYDFDFPEIGKDP